MIEKALVVGQRVASTQRLSFERVNQCATTASTSALGHYTAYPEICLRKVSFAFPQQILRCFVHAAANAGRGRLSEPPPHCPCSFFAALCFLT